MWRIYCSASHLQTASHDLWCYINKLRLSLWGRRVWLNCLSHSLCIPFVNSRHVAATDSTAVHVDKPNAKPGNYGCVNGWTVSRPQNVSKCSRVTFKLIFVGSSNRRETSILYFKQNAESCTNTAWFELVLIYIIIQYIVFHTEWYSFIHSLICSFVHSFIHYGYFYSVSSSPLLLRAASTKPLILCHK